MNPTTLLFLVAALACPIGMGVMMWLTAKRRNMGGQQSQSMSSSHTSQSARLKELREQRRLLEQEIAEVEKIAALEAQKEALSQSRSKNPDDKQPQPVESARN